ncbi:MAG: S-methyl-5-thioribose-1-phosphate isomerase [Spirochaetales bacterium]|nr:S-methyl-5-thioribose-1-phosphate isomerase [Spirochaetales bacterium]
MNINGRHFRTIWIKEDDPSIVCIINQQVLPHRFEINELKSVGDFRIAIKEMYVRGAGLIGAAAGYGIYIAALTSPRTGYRESVCEAGEILAETRPTASNLKWAVTRQLKALERCSSREEMIEAARLEAVAIADEDAAFCRKIGEHGRELIRQIAREKAGKNKGPVQILTHCNAGWLAFVDFGSALAPVYAAFDEGIDVHVWVDETRPRNQGAGLTAWELGQHGVAHDLIPDNAGGYLMQQGMVDLVITGADRVARNGDAANKIGTYLKAIAARDNNIPFYIALPSSTFDFSIQDGVKQIPIEERDSSEVRFMTGKTGSGAIETIQICPDSTPARNWGFDVTPGRLISGLICERGICEAREESILALFPEHRV